MKKILLFDLDQTILNRDESLYRFLNWQINFLQLIPQNSKQKFIQRFIELDDHGRVWKDQVYHQLSIEFNFTKYTVNELLTIYISDFNKFSVAFEHAEITIKHLYQNGYKLGLISNGRTPFQEHNFYALGLSEYFSGIFVSEALQMRKPQPEIFLYVCTQFDCNPSDCIFIGDNPIADIAGTKNVGMRTIFFNSNNQQNCFIADEQIQHFYDLETAIRRIENN